MQFKLKQQEDAGGFSFKNENRCASNRDERDEEIDKEKEEQDKMKPKTVRIMTNAQAAAVQPEIRSGSSKFHSIEERKICRSTRKIVGHDESRSTIMYSSENDNSEYYVDSDLGEESPAH